MIVIAMVLMSMSINFVEGDEGKAVVEENGRPRVGVQVKVGTYMARTMQYQDWWQTTFITEILEEEENYIKFKTGNSIYEWKII